MPAVQTHPCVFFLVLNLALFNVVSTRGFTTEDPASWTGKWFPEKPESLDRNLGVDTKNRNASLARIPMGIPNSNCDDGKSNLSVDWDGSYEDYICLSPRNRYIPNLKLHHKLEFENIPKAYMAPHYCMQQPIHYQSQLPTFGPHRPLWPRYGEYEFVPKQRWLHSLEHGAIVALYHPCADFRQIGLLKKLVKKCIRRHIIAPSASLTRERPLALLAWGVRLTMPAVNPEEVQEFIRKYALQGPEHLPDQGQYDFLLLKEAEIVSDFEDSVLCPSINF